MNQRQRTGQFGEETATAYLVAKGYKIVARNWRCLVGELDIIAQDNQTLVFIEVRTRRGIRFGQAAESITPTKQTRLVELAYTYLQELNLSDCRWRIDVVAIQLHHGLPDINHLENVVGW